MTFDLRNIRWTGKLQPTFALPCTQPVAVYSSFLRRTLEKLQRDGFTVHSAMGGTLWAVIDYLQRSRTPYVLEARPGEGYVVKLLKE